MHDTAIDDKPWLARKDWAARTVHVFLRVRGFTVVLIAVSFGLPGLAAAVLATDAASKAFGIVFVVFTIACFINWLLATRFGPPVCILETLPGVIGGWFKARVEVDLPYIPAEGVTVTLANVTMYDDSYAHSDVWSAACSVPASALVRSGNDRYSIPVRIAIPVRGKVPYVPITAPYSSQGEWHLTVSAKMPLKDFKATFSVPVFATDRAPPDEQTAGESGLSSFENKD